MPTYEYVCTGCENEWEEVQKISEAALEVCPKCRKSTAKRQISGGSFILKGGGWYADLYSSSKKPDGKTKETTEAKHRRKARGKGGGRTRSPRRKRRPRSGRDRARRARRQAVAARRRLVGRLVGRRRPPDG